MVSVITFGLMGLASASGCFAAISVVPSSVISPATCAVWKVWKNCLFASPVARLHSLLTILTVVLASMKSVFARLPPTLPSPMPGSVGHWVPLALGHTPRFCGNWSNIFPILVMRTLRKYGGELRLSMLKSRIRQTSHEVCCVTELGLLPLDTALWLWAVTPLNCGRICLWVFVWAILKTDRAESMWCGPPLLKQTF